MTAGGPLGIARPKGLAWAFRAYPNAEEIAARFRARHGPEIAAHEARLAAGWGDVVLATVSELVEAESDEPAPPLTAYVFVDNPAGVGVGLSWRSAVKRGLDWYVQYMLDPECAVDVFADELEDDPEAKLREVRARWQRVTVTAESPEALLQAVRLLTEGLDDLMSQLRGDLASCPATRPVDQVATAHNALLDEARALLGQMADDPDRLRSALRALRCR